MIQSYDNQNYSVSGQQKMLSIATENVGTNASLELMLRFGHSKDFFASQKKASTIMYGYRK